MGEPDASTATRRVLLLEDHDAVREVVSRMLDGLGYAFVATATGRACLGWAMAKRVDFDVLLSDVDLPDIDGVTVAVEVRELRPGIPIVMMTGAGFAAVERGLRTLTPPPICIEKPFGRPALSDALDSALAGSAWLQFPE